MGNVVPFRKKNKAQTKKSKTPKKKRPRRGQICGLIPVPFLAKMLRTKYSTLQKLFYKRLKEQGLKARDMQPEELCDFIEYFRSIQKRTTNIEDLITE